jgi:DNA-directed RNA polymerase subunit RPC12/RpoP
MADVLRCPNCGSEVIQLTRADGRLAIQLEFPRVTIFSARVRCPHCGTWVYFSAKKLEVAPA